MDEASALGPPLFLEMTIVAQDPSITRPDGRIVTATVHLPSDRFKKPFQSQRFHVVSFDPATGLAGPPLGLLDEAGVFHDRFTDASNEELHDSPDFHAQNVFAIANKTLMAFEGALGRRVPWDFDGHQLYLIPHGEVRGNAHYSGAKHALIFGYTDRAGPRIYSALGHDVIAHETTHAILDGLRPGYFNPGLPDQGGFHEGFADVVALLSLFAVPGIVEEALRRADGGEALTEDDLQRKNLARSLLLQLGEEFGEAVHGEHGVPLRDSVKLEQGDHWRSERRFREVHNRGEVLVAAVGNSLLDMWTERLRVALKAGAVSRQIAADEGAKAAQHLLTMAIRAIDYCPPVEFEYEDFIDALYWSDSMVAPYDKHDYRGTIERNFLNYDIRRPRVDRRVPHDPPLYERFNYLSLRSDRDEVFRFMWENPDIFRVDLDFHTSVETVRPSIRVGPDGFVVQETVVTYEQQLEATAGELLALSNSADRRGFATGTFALPTDLDPATRVIIFGGGSVIFDQFGRPKFHLAKPLLDWDRQRRRLEFLDERGSASSTGKIGAVASARVELLAALHERERLEEERW